MAPIKEEVQKKPLNMPKFHEQKTLKHSAHKVHALVMDIEKYPEFLPWCKQAKIVEVVSQHNLHADLLINFKNFFEKYRSDVHHGKDVSGQYFVEAKAIAGPFKKMISKWQIKEISAKECEVEFFIDFEFNSIILEKILGIVFEKAATKMMECFEARLEKIS